MLNKFIHIKLKSLKKLNHLITNNHKIFYYLITLNSLTNHSNKSHLYITWKPN